MKSDLNLLMFGAGAIGGTVGAWIAEKYENITFLDQGPIAEAMKSRGITHYMEGKKSEAKTVRVKVVESLADAPKPDIVIIAVKNYSLDGVSKAVKDAFGDSPIIVGLQNGVANQDIFPKYFSKVIYGVISYNAWLDEPAVIGWQKKGPIILGTVKNDLQDEMNAVSGVFGKGVETVITEHLQDAARSKMIINLTNSLTTLVGHGFQEISDMAVFQKLLSNLLFEGVRIIQGAGYKECKLGGMPPWVLLSAGARLPRFITKGMFEKNVKKMVMSSMAQDIIQRGGMQSELDDINGYFIKLADARGLKAPYNRAIYELCRERFGKPEFKPIDVKEVMAKVQEKM